MHMVVFKFVGFISGDMQFNYHMQSNYMRMIEYSNWGLCVLQ